MWFPAHRPIKSLFRVICCGPHKTKQQDKGASVAVTWLYSQLHNGHGHHITATNWSRGREKFEAWNWLVNKQVTVTLCKIIVTQKKRQLRIDSQSVTSGHWRLKHTNKSIKTTLSGIFLFLGGGIGSTQSGFCVQDKVCKHKEWCQWQMVWFCVPSWKVSYPWSVYSLQKV